MNTQIKKGDKISFMVTDFRMQPSISKIVTRKVKDVVIHHTGRVSGYNVNSIGSGIGYDKINYEDIISIKTK